MFYIAFVLLTALLNVTCAGSICEAQEENSFSFILNEINALPRQNLSFLFLAPLDRNVSSTEVCFFRLNETISIDVHWDQPNKTDPRDKVYGSFTITMLPRYNNDSMVLILKNSTGTFRNSPVQVIVRDEHPGSVLNYSERPTNQSMPPTNQSMPVTPSILPTGSRSSTSTVSPHLGGWLFWLLWLL